jgi:hypothetical protein
LNAIDFDTGGIFDRLCDRLRNWTDFDALRSFQQLQQWKFCTGERIDPALAATPIARWQHLELPPNFLQFLNTLLLQFFEGVHRLGKGWVIPTS